MPARTIELWVGVLQDTSRAGGLPLSDDAAAVPAAATALCWEQPAGRAVGRLPPPPPHGGAAEVGGRVMFPRRLPRRRRPRRARGVHPRRRVRRISQL